MTYSRMSDAVFYNANIALLACQLTMMLISLGVALYAVSSARQARTVSSTLQPVKTDV